MTQSRSMSIVAWLFGGLALWALPSSAQTNQNGQVEIKGALPRTAVGAVDVALQVQFDRPGVNNDYRARVGREEGPSQARIEGIDQSQLTETERQNLRPQFDRFRLEDANVTGNRTDNHAGRGNNSRPGSENSGSGSVNSGSGRAGNEGRRDGDDLRVAQAGDVRQEDRREERRADRQQDRREDRRANTGELRGLDRADQVAGDHGQQGRDNARAAQMDRPNRPDRVERLQRPDRPERPQRPERPEKPERAGRN